MALSLPVGPEGNLLETTENQAERLWLPHPVLTDDEMAREQDWAAYDDPFGDWHEDPCDDFDAADDVNQRHQDDEGH